MLVIRHPEWADSTMPSIRYKPVRKKMPTNESIGTRTHSDDSERPKAIRLGVDLVRVVPEGYDYDYAETTHDNSDTPKVIEMGIGLARKLFHRAQDDHSDSARRVDRIFYVHATNEEHTLHQRRTVEDLQQPMKLNISKHDISKPMTSPPAPDETLMHRYQKRQADWRKRSILMKSKRMDSVKRWSLKTWKTQSGREISQDAAPVKSCFTENSNKCMPEDSTKGVNKIPDQVPYAREHIHISSSLRSANLEITVRPVPSISANRRVDTFLDQRWNPLTSSTLDVIEEQSSPWPSPLRPTHHHAASTTHIPCRQTCHDQVLRKSASTSIIRPEVSQDGHLAVPTRSRSSNTNDQRHIHPALRTRPFFDQSAPDQRHIHPALGSELVPSLGTTDQRHVHQALRTRSRSPSPASTDQRHIHPALRHELGPSLRRTDQRHIHPALCKEVEPSLGTFDQQHIHPALRNKEASGLSAADQQHIHPAIRRQPSIMSGDTWCTVSTTTSAQPVLRSVPRVRIPCLQEYGRI